jgi:membrane-bound inhibitor of C-type lysozyme
MKPPTSLLIATLASYGLAYLEPAGLHNHVLRSNGTGTCSMSSNGSSHSITFQAQFDSLTVTGEGQSGPSGIQLSFTVMDGDALVIQHSQSSSGSGYNTTWDYGKMFSGISSLSLLTHNDNTTLESIDHGPLKPISAGVTNSTFTSSAHKT